MCTYRPHVPVRTHMSPLLYHSLIHSRTLSGPASLWFSAYRCMHIGLAAKISCMLACMFPCSSPACSPACSPARLHVRLHVHLHVCLHVHLHVRLHARLHARTHQLIEIVLGVLRDEQQVTSQLFHILKWEPPKRGNSAGSSFRRQCPLLDHTEEVISTAPTPTHIHLGHILRTYI